jgi:glycosyltransferase involved in cell wall biosynthesis
MTFLEVQACGVPCIAHDFSSLTELVKGHGWLAKSVATDLNMELTPILADTRIPDVYDIAEKIKEAYFREDLRKKYGKESRQFAIQYNWDDLVKYKWLPLLEKVENELKARPISERLIE